MGPWYATYESALRRVLGTGQTPQASDVLVLKELLESVSREVERRCGRHFQPRTETHYLTAPDARALLLDFDLLGVTTLQTDADGDRTYETTWATTDYDLEPANAALGALPEPYWEMVVNRATGNYFFPVGVQRGVKLVGKTGYFDLRESAGTLGAAISSTSTTSVTMSAGHGVETGHTLRIDDEDLFVTNVATNTLTVARGANGTTAATHTNGTAVQKYVYGPVTEATLRKVAQDFFHRSATSSRGGGDLAQSIGGLPWDRPLLNAGLVQAVFA